VSPRPRRYGGGGLRAPREVNKSKCHVCGAEKGDTCFVLTANSFRELSETHRTRERKKRAETRRKQARPTPPDFRPMVLDETYDR
jgi:hypothetical protein